jgi:hypothetical protein
MHWALRQAHIFNFRVVVPANSSIFRAKKKKIFFEGTWGSAGEMRTPYPFQSDLSFYNYPCNPPALLGAPINIPVLAFSLADQLPAA